MSAYSKFLQLASGAARTVDLSNAANTLAVANMQLLGSTSGTLTHKANATTTTYTLTWPAAVAASAGYVLSSDTSGTLSWVAQSGGANTALSNLASVAINTSLLPASSGSANVGSLALPFGVVYANALATNNLTTENTSALTVQTLGQSTASTNSGSVTVTSGNASGTTSNSGNVIIATGSATGTRGVIQFQDGSQGTAGQVWTSTDVNGSGHWAPIGGGTVTSVAIADTSTTPIYAVSGSPVTTSGTIDITLNNQSANLVFAGPATGSAAQPTFRSLVAADIPSLSGYANTTLSNLGTTAINASLVPGTSVTYSLGSTSSQWLYGYIEYLLDASGNNSVSTFNRQLFDVGGNQSIDWGNRELKSSSSVIQATWSSSGLQLGVGATNNGVLSFANATNAFLANISAANTITASYNFNLPASAGTAGQVLTSQGGGSTAMTWTTPATGSVTSVTFTGDGTVLSSTPSSAVTTTGTLTATLKTQSNNTFLAGPTSGGPLAPTFRLIASSDIPATIAANTTGTAANVTATSNATLTTLSALTTASSLSSVGTITSGTWTGTTIAIANGGTGQTSANAAFNALSPMTTGGDLIYGGASGVATRLANGSSGQVLTSSGGTAAPTWTTPPNGITSISVASANGFAGSSSGGTTPALTISTSITGVLKGNGTAISAATAGSDYSAGTSALGTGILKSTTGTGALTIAIATDFPTLNQNTTGTAANITATSNSTLTTLSALSLPTSQLTGTISLSTQASGTLQAAQFPALTGDVTTTAGSLVTTLAAVATGATVGSSTSIPTFTFNNKGLVTSASGNAVVAPAGTLSGTVLNSTVVTSSLTSVGTIATGTWAGTTIATNYGGTGVTTVTTAPTASAWAGWDANKNLSANSYIAGYTTTATAAGTTTLTVGSTQQQYFTGTTTQTVRLPVTSTLVLGQSFAIVNNSTGVVTVQSSGGNTVQAMAANSQLVVTVINTGVTTAAGWSNEYSSETSGTVTSVAFADASTTPIYTITGSPVTVSGTLTQTLTSQAQNSVFAGPTSGSSQPSFRALVAADIPSLSAYANTTLSNLGTTSINSSLVPGSSGTINVGSTTSAFLNLYVTNITNGASGNANINVATRQLADSSSIVSLDYSGRKLLVGSTTMLDWGTTANTININSNTLTGLANPVNPTDAVNYSTLTSLVNGASWKNAALVATTANITLSGEQTIDGITTSSSRVLVKNQSTASQNGLYTSGTGAWTRTSDMNTWAEVPAAAVFVQEGTVNADIAFVCTSSPGGTLGTTAITFVQFSSAGSYTADNVTLQLSSGVFSIKNAGVTSTQIATSALSATGALTGGAGTPLAWVPDNTSLQISSNAARIATGAYDGVTISGGGGTAASVIAAPSIKRTLVAGQTFTANTSYAVRWGLPANGETSTRVYAADITTSSYDLFYVIGMASSATTISAGGNITVTTEGSFNLSSADTAFATNTDGTAVYLTASGTFSTTSPSTSGQAVTRVGIVRTQSATVTSNVIDVMPQTIGIN